VCDKCSEIILVFEKYKAKKEYGNMIKEVCKLIVSKIEQNEMEIYAADCPIEKIMETVEKEEHYTICTYLKCLKCKNYYFFGICIRGEPVYKKIENINSEKIDSLICGKYGSYFEKNVNF